MDLRKQVVSITLAKKMKRLGFKQGKAEFTYVLCTRTKKYKIVSFHGYFAGAKTNYHARGHDGYDGSCGVNGMREGFGEMFDAYTIAELGEMLRKTQKYEQVVTWWDFDFNKYRCLFQRLECEDTGCWLNIEWTDHRSEVNAKAAMAIYLKENKLI